MGDILQAHDRQPVVDTHQQDSTQLNNGRQSSENSFPASGEHAPFYSQFGAFSQASHTPPSQHGNLYPNYQYQQSMHGLDMSSIGHALPGSSPSSASSRGFHQQAPSYIDGVPAQTSGMKYGPQLHHYGPQAYVSNMTMHMRTQAHPSGMVPQYYYNGYSVPVSQASMQRQGQPMAGYPTMPMMSYNRSEFNSKPIHSQSYLSHPRPELVSQPTPSYPRGPPRKPRQSGHALWVGNLPPATTIGDLKDHFSREATNDIESLFLISKSNCAFVNYRSEAACTAAMGRFHDSRFHGVRLVCRLRRGTPTSGYSASTTPELSTSDSLTPESSNEAEKLGRKELRRMPSGPVIVHSSSSQSPKKDIQHDGIDGVDEVDGLDKAGGRGSARVPEKYFVVKSLTLQDLEASVRSGVWATQSHNEVALNHAYETADNVFLVFSANKSGEYFGYARMTSPISSQPPTASTKLQPKTKDLDSGPKSIPTPATQWAPKGRIVDDSARGTIFWEVDNTPEHQEEATLDGAATQQSEQEEKETGSLRQRQEWGKSFQVDWISTNRLPFYRTRGLRNPWNENREIKIARDGTEIEPSIGQRLVQMFHHPVLAPRNNGPPRMVA